MSTCIIPIIEEELVAPIVEEPIVEVNEPMVEPVKKKRVQSEKQKAAFVLLQEKRKVQVEKQKLIKKIEASKLLLENDVPLEVK